MTSRPAYPYYREILAEQSAMWADQYALTMSQAHFTLGMHETRTTFHAYIRSNPFEGAYTVSAGQNIIAEWYEKFWRFDEVDIHNMRRKVTVNPDNGELCPLYTAEFIDFCASAKPELTIDAVPEGELVFEDEPMYRVHGPVWQALMVEGAILNSLNSQSLFATLASRLVNIAEGAPVVYGIPDPVIEAGLRRAQSVNGLSATRAAYIGGISSTSNMLAEKYYDIPSGGTMAHAFVMLHESELQAFRNYAKAMPYNGVFLVDTYDTLQGIKNAAQACRETNVKLKGIRLDSGDLAYLSKQGRQILDAEGFREALITNADGQVMGQAGIISASNDLDEEKMHQIKRDENGQIHSWVVGTRLVTASNQPALGGVYKLAAVYDADLTQEMIDSFRRLAIEGRTPDHDRHYVRDVLKLSQDAIKITTPGELDFIRFQSPQGRLRGDTIVKHLQPHVTDKANLLNRPIVSVHKEDESLRKTFEPGTPATYPMQPMFDHGRQVSPTETVHEGKERAKARLANLDPDHRRLLNPHRYVVGIELSLFEQRKQMISQMRGL